MAIVVFFETDNHQHSTQPVPENRSYALITNVWKQRAEENVCKRREVSEQFKLAQNKYKSCSRACCLDGGIHLD
jgi:hypothetical protein